MVLESKILDLYERISFYDRYESLSKNHSSDSVLLEKQNKSQVINLFNNLGYEAKQIFKENFYHILEKSDNYEFYFHIGLKYGIAEIIVGAVNENNNTKIGGISSRICKLIKRSNSGTH